MKALENCIREDNVTSLFDNLFKHHSSACGKHAAIEICKPASKIA